ncbi:alpha/beta hydrolase [Embleya sp. MST-111070]|uniref:alpha/beta hydrolase n=1 Tax=Embleya sp. MST-111070 TaxID=3398231 RepID=UPI003F740754
MATVLLGTALALAPRPRPRWLAESSFRVGLLVDEMPVFALIWLAGWSAWAYAQGDLDSFGGRIAAATAALTAVGILVLLRRATHARPALARALTSALGPDHRPSAGPTTASTPAHPTRPSPLHIALAPFLRRRRDVRRIANIAYGDAPGGRNLLDVYHPRPRRHRAGNPGSPALAPVLIHLHGGGYHRGRKNSQSLPLIHRLASRGWICVSANHRLRPAAQHPDHLIDAKKVVAWARQHAHEYGGDPNTLFVSGSSAGDHLAALAALTPGDPAYQPGFEAVDTSVTAAIVLNGYLGPYYGQGEESAPGTHVHPDAPPFFIAHGTLDTIVPIEIARTFARTLEAHSRNPVVYAELPGALHAFDLFHSPRFEAVVDAVETFATRVLARTAGGRVDGMNS